MGDRLDSLLEKGVTGLATFVPWQAFEADISHRLLRFLQAASERNIPVSLIVSPEMGVHYAYSGIPKDLALSPEVSARNSRKQEQVAQLPPHLFALPSLYSPDFNKRYFGFLARFQSFLADLYRSNPRILERVSLIQTGSYWKSYRDVSAHACDPFAGVSGDRSKSATLMFRKDVDKYYSQREFLEPEAISANRWKAKGYESVNLKWFQEQSEQIFRHRASQSVQRTGMNVPTFQMELFTPEADPALAFSAVLQALARGNADFASFSRLLDEYAARQSHVCGELAKPYVHWSALGGFKTLSDAEKQFLILKSLLLFGGRSGGLLIDEAEWFSLSQTFRNRVEVLSRSFEKSELKLSNAAVYLNPHLWSEACPLWKALHSQVGAEARMISSLDLLLRENEASLAIVDPEWIVTSDQLKILIRWAERGKRILALPRTVLYTEAAKSVLAQLSAGKEMLDIRIGVSYQVQAAREGKIVLYDTTDLSGDAGNAFVRSLVSLSGQESAVRMSDGRLASIPLQKALFVLNGTGRIVAADLLFTKDVVVSDLAGDEKLESGKRFHLEVPPCGVLPLAIKDTKSKGSAESLDRGAAAWN